jgi:hypothetical protein
MATYEALRDRALSQVSLTGQSEAQAVAQIALEEAMKFVAFHVRIPSLIASAQATAPASPELEANAIALEGSGFNISSGVYQCPDRLYIKKDTSTVNYGVPYEYIEFHHFVDLKSIPASVRVGVIDSITYDERPTRSWTVTPTSKVWAEPIAEGNVVTLFYRKNPAAYVSGNTPEILARFDFILVNAAVLALKEWLREPATITTLWSLFQTALIADVQQYDLELNGQRKRSHLKIHRSYRPR